MVDKGDKNRGWLSSMLGRRDDVQGKGGLKHGTDQASNASIDSKTDNQVNPNTECEHAGDPSGTGTRTGSVSSFEDASRGRPASTSRSGSTRRGKKKKVATDAEQEMGLYAQMVADFKAKQGTASGARTVSTSSAEGGGSGNTGEASRLPASGGQIRAGAMAPMTSMSASKEAGRDKKIIDAVRHEQAPSARVNVKAARTKFEPDKEAEEENFSMDSLLAKFGASRRGSIKPTASKRGPTVKENGPEPNHSRASDAPPPRSPTPKVAASEPPSASQGGPSVAETGPEPNQSRASDAPPPRSPTPKVAVPEPPSDTAKVPAVSEQDAGPADAAHDQPKSSENAGSSEVVSHEAPAVTLQPQNSQDKISSTNEDPESAHERTKRAAARRAEFLRVEALQHSQREALVLRDTHTQDGKLYSAGELLIFKKHGKKGWTYVQDCKGLNCWLPSNALQIANPDDAEDASLSTLPDDVPATSSSSKEEDSKFHPSSSRGATRADATDSRMRMTRSFTTPQGVQLRTSDVVTLVRHGKRGWTLVRDDQGIKSWVPQTYLALQAKSESIAEGLEDIETSATDDQAPSHTPKDTKGRSPDETRTHISLESRLMGMSPGDVSWQKRICAEETPGNVLVEAQIGFAQEGAGRWVVPMPVDWDSARGVRRNRHRSQSPDKASEHGYSFHENPNSPIAGRTSSPTAQSTSTSPNRKKMSPTAMLPVSLLSPSHCTYCGALPSTPNREGKLRRFRRCARCKSVDYCSTRCQRLDWKAVHRSECLPVAEMERFDDSDARNRSKASMVSPGAVTHVLEGSRRLRPPNASSTAFKLSVHDSNSLRPHIHETFSQEARCLPDTSVARLSNANSPPQRARNPEMPVEQRSKSPTPGLHVPSFSALSSRHVRKPIHSERGMTALDPPEELSNDARVNHIFRPSLSPEKLPAEAENCNTSRRFTGNEEASSTSSRIESKGWTLQEQHATELLEMEEKVFTATKVPPDPRQRESMEAFGRSGPPGPSSEEDSSAHAKPAQFSTADTGSSDTMTNKDLRDPNRLHADSLSVSKLRRAIRLDFVGADQMPFEDGRRIDCRIRLLCARQRPVDLHTYSGKIAGGKLQMSRRTPFDIFVPDSDFLDAELEHTLWDLSAGTERFLGGCALKASQVLSPEEEEDAGLRDVHLSVLLVDLVPDAPDMCSFTIGNKIRLLVEHRIKTAPADAGVAADQGREETDTKVDSQAVQRRRHGIPAGWVTQEQIFRPSNLYRYPGRLRDESALHRTNGAEVGWSAFYWSAGEAASGFRHGVHSALMSGAVRSSLLSAPAAFA